jgi:hypothetical protein
MTLSPHRAFPAAALLALALLLIAVRILAQSPPRTEIPMATEDRLQTAAWWPTKSPASRETLAGTAECAKCHSAQAATQLDTPMAHASALPADTDILRSHDHFSQDLAPYHYEIARSGTGYNYSVNDASSPSGTLVEPLTWAFGIAHKGQTYIYNRDGIFYESHLSFYKSLQGLALTTGHLAAPPGNLEAALGRRLSNDEARRCFACHTTGSAIAGNFDPSSALPGVACEQCHGPGAKHVSAMKMGKIEEGRSAILNPRRLNAVASVDFCGACHRTWADVLQAGITGVANVRFQPYRLESSRCWRKGDARLACIACHNPHEQLVHDAAAYDQKCLSCHITGAGEKLRDHPGSACPVSKNNCVTCHMPQVELPSMHATFTDHRIRIVRENAPYPN